LIERAAEASDSRRGSFRRAQPRCVCRAGEHGEEKGEVADGAGHGADVVETGGKRQDSFETKQTVGGFAAGDAAEGGGAGDRAAGLGAEGGEAHAGGDGGGRPAGGAAGGM